MGDIETPEYQAITSNRRQLEEMMAPHLAIIAEKLRDQKTLTPDQCSEIKDKAKSSTLIEALLPSLKFDPVETFIEVVHVMKQFDHRAFQKFIKTKIEAKVKEHYRKLLSFKGAAGGQSYDVFISYGREEEVNRVVDQFSACLTKEGLTVFVDRKSLQPGDVWPAEIVNAINTCKIFVVMLTKNYVISQYCQGELYEADALGKRFFPVVVEKGWDEEIAGIPVKSVLQEYHYGELVEPKADKLCEFATLIAEKIKPKSIEGQNSVETTTSANESEATSEQRKKPEKKLTTQKLSFENLCDQFNLTMEDFNQEISDDHILDIYPQLENWERVAARLGFSGPDIEDIRHKAMLDVKLMKMYMLQRWKSKGIIYEASTYKALIEALWKSESNKTVKFVCELLLNQ